MMTKIRGQKGKVLVGPFFTFIYILLIFMTQGKEFQPPHSLGIFSIIIVCSIFIGGLSSGIISSIIAVAYLVYSFAISNNKVYYHNSSFCNILEEAIILFGVVLIFSLMKRNIRQKSQALIESEESYRQLVEFLPDAICVHKKGKIIFGNDAILELLGVKSEKEYLGKSVMEFVKKDYHDVVDKRIEDVNSVGDIAPLMEEKFIGVNGREIDVEVKTASIIYKGENATLVTVRDITERKKAEELQEKVEINKKMLDEARKYDKIKTEFFANISHEFRTPLNIILGSVQILDMYTSEIPNIDGNLNLEKRINSMKQNCFRLIRLVNNLIDITKIDSGYYDIFLQNHNIVHIVEEITLSVAEYIEDKGVSLTFDTDVEEKIMSCDPNKIEKIILNLLSNAVKFTEPGDNIIVHIYDKGDNVSISVKDTGIGIPESKRNMIFERFAQVDKSLNRNREGSGIGLSIVKALVEMHGGSIALKSEYGIESEFIINLPVRIIEENNETKWHRIGLSEGLIEMINIEFSDIYS